MTTSAPPPHAAAAAAARRHALHSGHPHCGACRQSSPFQLVLHAVVQGGVANHVPVRLLHEVVARALHSARRSNRTAHRGSSILHRASPSEVMHGAGTPGAQARGRANGRVPSSCASPPFSLPSACRPRPWPWRHQTPTRPCARAKVTVAPSLAGFAARCRTLGEHTRAACCTVTPDGIPPQLPYRGVEQTEGRHVDLLALLRRPVVRIS